MTAGAPVAVKPTTQNAVLEPFLARLRTAKARPWVRGKSMLDFGCGANLWTLRALAAEAKDRIGFDQLFGGVPPRRTDDGILLVGALDQLPDAATERVVALACFEHIEEDALPGVLDALARVTTPDGIVFATVPAPPAKPVLEFLAYRLGLIDRSQIEDHKVYYDRARLERVVAKSRWRLTRYKRFQLGMNSWFTLEKT